MPAKSAQAFADSVGVNVHASYTDTVYGDWNRVVTELKSLGIRHVRDGLYANPTWGAWNTEHWNKINQLPANGIKANLILGHPRYNGGSIDNLVAAVRDRVRGAVESVEGPNEWDLNGGSTWVQDLRAYQTALYQKVRATPELNGVPVLAPSFGWMHTPAQAGDLKAFTDRRNMHPYTGGRAPSQDHLAGELSRAAAVAGDDPAIATEAGFHTAMSATNGQPPTSEAATGAYVPRTFLEHFKAGIERTFLYELVDLRNDTSRTDAEAAFGLYRNNWTPKPGASSLRNLMGLVRDSARVDNPGALDVTMTGDTAGVQHLLLKHSDGSYALVLWQSESVWDHTNRRDLAVPTQRVNLAVAEKFGKVETFRPTAGAAAVKTQTSSASIAVDVPGDPVVIKLSAPETGTNEPVTSIVSDPNPTPGLRAEFFSGIGLTGTSTSRVEPGVNYFWGQGSPAGLPGRQLLRPLERQAHAAGDRGHDVHRHVRRRLAPVGQRPARDERLVQPRVP
jgi:hypothetical protein